MSGRSWWLLVPSLIGVALVALLAIIAYALLSDEDGESAEQVAQSTVMAAPTPPPLPTPTPPPPTFEASIENPFEPCNVEEVVLTALGASCVWEFDPQGCYSLAWADYVIEESCPHRRSGPWSADRCEEAIQRLGFMEELCREQGETDVVSAECSMVKVMGDLFADHCSR